MVDAGIRVGRPSYAACSFCPTLAFCVGGTSIELILRRGFGRLDRPAGALSGMSDAVNGLESHGISPLRAFFLGLPWLGIGREDGATLRVGALTQHGTQQPVHD